MTNATIINNELSDAESGLRIDNPYLTVNYFDKPKPVAGGRMFFGVVGEDPEIPANQKRVYLIQEDGSVLPIAQPVQLSNGGVPSYNGSPAKLAVDGTYSWKVIDKNGAVVYYSPRTSQPSLQQIGESRIIEETVTLTENQSSVTFERADLSMATVDVIGPTVDSRPLLKDVDYNISDGAAGTLYLINTFPQGSIIRVRQNAFSNQEETSVSSYPWAYDTIAEAVAEDLNLGDKVMICGKDTFEDSLAYHLYRVVAGGTGINDGKNFINMDNGLQLQALSPRADFKNYSEDVVIATVESGVLTMDASQGMVQLKDLRESVSSIVLANIPQDQSTTITLRVRQKSGGNHSINFAGFLASGGNPPTITQALDSVDVIIFHTFDGSEWHVYQAAENAQVIV